MRFLHSVLAVLAAALLLLLAPMATKSYYPTFRRLVHALVIYLGKYQAKMSTRLGIAGTGFATDLAALVSALNQIEANWPTYDELP